jgi:hypothetical protein
MDWWQALSLKFVKLVEVLTCIDLDYLISEKRKGATSEWLVHLLVFVVLYTTGLESNVILDHGVRYGREAGLSRSL